MISGHLISISFGELTGCQRDPQDRGTSIVPLSSSNVGFENSSSRLKFMISFSRMSSFFVLLGSCLEDYSC